LTAAAEARGAGADEGGASGPPSSMRARRRASPWRGHRPELQEGAFYNLGFITDGNRRDLQAKRTHRLHKHN